MRCSFDKNLLQGYLEKTITPLENIILEEHLKVCNDCRRDLIELKLLFWELKEMPCIDLPPEAFAVKNEVLKMVTDLEIPAENLQSFGIKDLVKIQNHIIHSATLFLKFIPGNKIIANTTKSSAKKASSFIGNLVLTSIKSKPRNALLRNSL